MGIVERLRETQCPENMGCNPLGKFCQCASMDDAADLIERLKEYAACLPTCQSVDESLGNPNPGGPCDCGLTALIKEIEGG